jgi:type IV secretory pathway VirB3-like protein
MSWVIRGDVMAKIFFIRKKVLYSVIAIILLLIALLIVLSII